LRLHLYNENNFFFLNLFWPGTLYNITEKPVVYNSII